MAALSFIAGLIGNIISILVFASPIKTFWGVVKKKSTENYKGVPYITTLMSTSLWTFYGILNPDGLLVMTVNGAGAILQLIYVIMFLIYAPMNKKVKTAKLFIILDVGFVGAVIAITLFAIHGSMRLTFVGILCSVLTIGMYAAPLAVMRMVIKTRSVKYMPFFLSFFLFLNGCAWSVYAVLVKDIYIGVPNAIGFVLGAAQLIIYAIYKKNSGASKSSMEGKEEHGSTHLVKEGIEMNALEEEDGDEESNMRNRNLNKGQSLPKPTINRQYSLQKIFSLNACDLNSSWANLDIEPDDSNRKTNDHT